MGKDCSVCFLLVFKAHRSLSAHLEKGVRVSPASRQVAVLFDVSLMVTSELKEACRRLRSRARVVNFRASSADNQTTCIL